MTGNGSHSQSEERLTRAERIFVRVNIAQTVLAVAGLFTGAVALYAALTESHAVRRQTAAAVWPYIDVIVARNNVPGERFFQVAIANKGIGPARIRSIQVSVDGEPQTDWWTLVDKAAELGGQRLILSNADAVGTVLSAGESIALMRAGATSLDPAEGVGSDTLLDRLGRASAENRFRMTICYCSVFDDCWMRDTAEMGQATRVASCPPQPENVQF